MRLPIQALKEIGNKYGYSVVVVYAFDDSKARQHIASWGKTIILCDQAAQWADKLKDALGWPESLHAMPNRVKKLQNQRDALRAENERLREALREIVKASSKYELKEDQGDDEYWVDNSYSILIEIDKIVEKALNEVKE